MHRRGFTLIELLVVIAIVAILAALLFPVLVRATGTAKTSKCIAHGHELGEASMMYMDDWNGRFPRTLTPEEVNNLREEGPYDWPGTPNKVESMWVNAIMSWRQVLLRKYVKNDAIWVCPSPRGYYTQRYAYGFRCSWLPRYDDGKGQGFVDGDRGFVNDDPDVVRACGGSAPGRTIAEVQALDLLKGNVCGSRYMPPSKKIMWMCYAFGDFGDQIITPGQIRNGWIQEMFPDYPHGDGSVFVYADGHAARKRMGLGWAPVGYTKLWMDKDPGG